MVKLSLNEYALYMVAELKKNEINSQDISSDELEAKIREFFDASNTVKQTDGSQEYLDDNEIEQAIDLAKQYASELKSKGEKPSLTPVQEQSSFNAPKTGDVVAVVCDNGATCQIKGTTITTITKDGTSTSREMTEEEKNLPTNELLEQLKKSSATSATSETDNAPRKVNGNGISGSYAFIEKENCDYTIEQHFLVNAHKNQAYKAYTKGLKNDFGFPQVKPDSDGYIRFRRNVAKFESALDIAVKSSANDIAIRTEIYKDLQARQNKGDSLSNSELKFMQDYNNLLQQSGLKMNENGDLEDI